MSVKPGSKYFPLFEFLNGHSEPSVRLALPEIEELIGEPLPRSARDRRGFWSNRRQGGHQASAWLESGYRVETIDLEAEQIQFKRETIRYHIPERKGNLRWTSESLRALRQYLGFSQERFAQELGVRQQTISEWETGRYVPTRASSKHLRLVAERAGFPYQVEETA
jgi:DNA-binding transcriptional regulator YiaG